jgi:dienelactone hydrolase
MQIVDQRRDNPYGADGRKRELMIRFWYPAPPGQDCKLAEYASPKVWAYVSQISGIPLPAVKTNSCANASVAEGRHPVVVFTHGYTGMFTDSTFVCEDLASRGYVVVSVAHTYETTAVEFPDGRLVKSVFGSYLSGNTLRVDDESLEFARTVRLADLSFVLDELHRLNSSRSPFAGKLDSRVGIMGHSLGGEASISSLEHEAHLSAAVLIDPVLSDASVVGTDKPVLILAAGREQWSEEECKLWSKLRGRRVAVNLKGADHLTPSDAAWLLRGVPELAVRTGTMGQKRTIAAVRNYIGAFFDTSLLAKPQSALLNGPSSDYPDAVVTAQKQSLCGGI